MLVTRKCIKVTKVCLGDSSRYYPGEGILIMSLCGYWHTVLDQKKNLVLKICDAESRHIAFQKMLELPQSITNTVCMPPESLSKNRNIFF